MDPHPVIVQVMKEESVTPKDIPFEEHVKNPKIDAIKGSKRYFKCKAFAWFNYHEGCGRSWPSAHSWCILDLKEQRIHYKFSQGCKGCEGEAEPTFDDEAIKRMATYAVETYLKMIGRMEWRNDALDLTDLADALDDERGPHDEERCEVCKQLGRSCWKKY